MKTLVLQSHRSPLPYAWLTVCLDSARRWAAGRGYDYRYLGDEIYRLIAELDLEDGTLLERARAQPVVGSDLARLAALEAAHREGYERAIWIDADVLLLPGANALNLPNGHGVGRQLWVQARRKGLRLSRQVHNAFMSFDAQDPLLPFYRRTATVLLQAHRAGPVAPQFIGPKLLTALHNIAQFNVIESAGMLPPLVARDWLRGHGDALARYQAALPAAPLALNLCGSLASEQTALQIELPVLVERLLANGFG